MLLMPAGRASRDWRLVAALIAFFCIAAGGCSPGRSPAPTGAAVHSVVSVSFGASGPTASASGGASVPITSSPAAPTALPAVVALDWLDGVSTAAAIRLQGDGSVRWQGSTSGEQAELWSDGYRWTGPDGSMVGCATPVQSHTPVQPDAKVRLRCVGVDAAGNTAVTAEAKGPRTVYGPDGSLLATFDAAGVKARAAGPTLSLSRAIASTGVDMAALVDFATGRMSFSGGITGDPHLITTGGIRVSTQRAGDFVARSGDQAHQIQIRTEPMPFQTDVSYVTAAAVGLPGHVVELSLTGDLTLDGSRVASRGGFGQTAVGDGPVVGLWPPDGDGVVHAVLLWPDGSTVSMSADPSLGLTVIARLPDAPVGGLFGVAGAAAGPISNPVTPTPNVPDPATGDQRGDFAARPPSSSAGSRSADQVVDSWRVPAGESLFAGGAAPAAQPFGPPAQISPAATLAAQKACAAGTLVRADDLAACVFDVARTGDDGYVVDHSDLAAAAVPANVPVSLARDWPALVLGTALSPESLDVGAQIERTVPAGGRRLYRLLLTKPASLAVTAGGCPDQGEVGEPGRGAAALRIFDQTGHPVSDRLSPCGPGKTDMLTPGAYYLVLAGPTTGADSTFKVRVTAG